MYARKLDMRPVFLVIGLFLTILSLAMLIPIVVALAWDHSSSTVFAVVAAFTFFVGGVIILASRTDEFRLSLRQAFILTTVIWIMLPAFAALPFVFSELDMNYTDAFFEAMSGLTTTGSTVIIGLDSITSDVLLWRAILQWLGGIGAILTALIVLPALGAGGMQIFRIEAISTNERLTQRVTSFATGLIGVYITLTIAWALVLYTLGMSSLESVAYAMTTISTGGFSTSDLSIAAFDSVLIELVIVTGMIIGSLPFLLYLQAIRGTPELLWRDAQVRTFLTILGSATMLVFIWLWLVLDEPLSYAARSSIFTTTSLMTGTGYTLGNYWQWNSLPVAILFFLSFVGGCAGSTTCAVKVFRLQIIYAMTKTQMARALHPHGVFIPYYNHRPIPEGVPEGILGFFFLYAFTLTIVSLLLSLIGLDFVTAFLVSATALSNVGQGISVACISFAYLPDTAKWILSVTMLMGRLEIFSVLILFLPDFWRK